jgi:hypothetical protein
MNMKRWIIAVSILLVAAGTVIWFTFLSHGQMGGMKSEPSASEKPVATKAQGQMPGMDMGPQPAQEKPEAAAEGEAPTVEKIGRAHV